MLKIVSFADTESLCFKPATAANILFVDSVQMSKIPYILKRGIQDCDAGALASLQAIAKVDRNELYRNTISASIRSLSALTRIARY